MEKVTDDAIHKSISGTLIETFDAMVSMELENVPPDGEVPTLDNRLVGTIHFGGEVVGVMNFVLSEPFSRAITASMLGMEVDEIESFEEVKDVIGEITNIVAGNLKSDFLDAGLACVISTPAITLGSDFKIDPVDIAPPLNFNYRHGDDYILIEFCAKEDIGSKQDVLTKHTSEAISERINSVDIKNSVINSVIDVFFTMLDMEVEAIQEVPDSFVEEMRTVGSVTFAGEVDGMFNIQINDDFGKIMTAGMLGMEVDEIESEEEVYDVIREVSNIIGGNLKSSFIDAGLSCVLSTPSITNGRDFRVSPSNVIKPERFLFSHNNHIIIVEAGVKNDTPPPAPAEEKEEEKPAQDASSEEPSAQAPQAPPDGAAAAQPASGDASNQEISEQLKNMGMVMDIPLVVTVELGRSRKKINDVLEFAPGSVVELEQMEGEPVDILINQTLIAKGHVVVEKEKYGIRISEVVSRKERLKSIH